MLRSPRIGPRRGQRGTALIEFALVLPFIILLTFLVVDLARGYMVKSLVEQSAREGARALAADTSTVRAMAMATGVAAAGGLNPSTIAVYLNPGSFKGDSVTCRVSSSFKWLYPGLLNFLGAPGSTVLVTGTNKCRREW